MRRQLVRGNCLVSSNLRWQFKWKCTKICWNQLAKTLCTNYTTPNQKKNWVAVTLLSHWQTNVRMIYPFCTRIRHVSQCTILGNFTLRVSTNVFYCRVCECSRICANIFYCIQLQLLFCLRWFYREYLNNDFDYQYYPGNSNHPGFQDIWCQNFIWILSGKLMIRGSKLLEKKFAQLF